MTPSSNIASVCRAVAGVAALALLTGCLSALSADDATTLRITNIGRDTVAVYPWDFETSHRSLRTFGGVALRESDLKNGLIAPGVSRNFPLVSILGYTPGRSIRVEVLSSGAIPSSRIMSSQSQTTNSRGVVSALTSRCDRRAAARRRSARSMGLTSGTQALPTLRRSRRPVEPVGRVRVCESLRTLRLTHSSAPPPHSA